MKILNIILLASMLFVSCEDKDQKVESTSSYISKTNSIKVTKNQFDGENMALGLLQDHNFNEQVDISGIIDVPPHNKASVTTFMGGYITRTPLLIGDKVRKGQLLVTLENLEYVEIQQNYIEIKEQLNFLKAEYLRQKQLWEENITSEKNFLKAESTYKSSLAQYNGLSKKLEMMSINPASIQQGNMASKINLYAPIDGYITKVNVSNGTYVSPADVILEIIDTDHIHLELSVFEKDILKIKKDQEILFKIPEASDEVFMATVHLVGTTIDEATRRVKVHAHVDNEKTNFIVGMFVDAHIVIKSRMAVGLPLDAIIRSENDNYVLMLKQKEGDGFIFEKIKVDIGEQNEEFAEILNSQALSDRQILIKGTAMLGIEMEE